MDGWTLARYSTNISRSDSVETAKENRVRFPVGVVTDNMADPLVRSDRPSFYAEVYPFISLETNNMEKASNCTCSYTASIAYVSFLKRMAFRSYLKTPHSQDRVVGGRGVI